MSLKTRKEGFTLVELLVVMAIIAILSSAVIAYLSSTRAKGRDARRLSDINEISKALALYESNHQQYPLAATQVTLSSTDAVSIALEGDGVITNTPTDPIYPGYAYTYVTNLTGSTYTLTFCLETNSNLHYVQGCTNTYSP